MWVGGVRLREGRRRGGPMGRWMCGSVRGWMYRRIDGWVGVFRDGGMGGRWMTTEMVGR